MVNKKSRRISASSAYIGAGNKSSNFSRKARKPFEDLAEIYRKEIKKKSNKEDYRLAFNQLNEKGKATIKNKIKTQIEAQKKQFITKIIYSSIATFAIVAISIWLIKWLFLIN